MTFDQLLRSRPWRPIRGCPGRYVLEGGHELTFEELTGQPTVVVRARVATARDEVWVAAIDFGGLISYRRDDGTFVHTLGDAEGFARKATQLGIRTLPVPAHRSPG